MAFFFTRKSKTAETPDKYPATDWIPAVRCSICTGEQVAGFKHRQTGKFEDVRLVRTPKELDAFLKEYGRTAEQVEKIY